MFVHELNSFNSFDCITIIVWCQIPWGNGYWVKTSLSVFFVSLDLLHNQLISHSIRTLIQNSGTPTIQCKQDHYLKHFMSLCGPLFRQDCKCKLSILEGPYLVYWKFALQQAMSAVLGILSLYLTCAGKEYFYCIYKQNRNLNKL